MNIDQCKIEDGSYTLLECVGYIEEFEMDVKDGKPTLYQITTNPFSKVKVDERNFTLLCDLHENENWFKDSDEKCEPIEKINLSSGKRR